MSLKLIKMELVNFRQFRHETFDFDGDTVCIIGPNGAGKSNALEAIYFALTGDVRTGSKSECLTDIGPNKQAEKGHVELTFMFNDVQGVIKRSLHSSSCSLTYGNVKKNKANDINDFMTDLIGINKRTFSKYCCVSQGSTEAIVSDQPSVRSDAFSELFGSHQCRKIYDLLGKEETGLQVVEYAPLVNDTRASITAINERLTAVNQQLTRLRDTLAKLGDQAGYEEIKRKYAVAAGLKQAQTAASNQLVTLTTNLNECKDEIKGAQIRFDRSGASLKELSGRYYEAEAYLRALDSNAALEAQYTQAQSRLYKLQKEKAEAESRKAALVEPVQDYDPRNLDALRTEVEHAQQVIEHHLKFSSTGDKLKCPTCGQEIANGVEQLELAKQTVGTKGPKLIEVRKKQTDYDAAVLKYKSDSMYLDSTLKRLICEITELVAERDRLAVELEKVKLPPGKDRAAEQHIVETYESMRFQHDTLHVGLESKRSMSMQLERQLDSLISQIEQVEAQLAQAPSQQEYQCALERLERISKVTEEINQSEGIRQGCQRELETASAALSKYEKLLEETTKTKAYKDLLASARNVMHRDNLPRIRAQRYIESINERLQYYLTRFDSKFQAVLQSDYEFQCTFPDGKIESSIKLSGGEKVRLGLAFRFAVNELFAKNLGLLILDEPTAFLDDANIHYLCELVDQMKVTAKNAGMQIIVVTHEQELRGHFDKSITIGVAQ